MPHILVTYDDGYQAPALAILARALRGVGEVTVFASHSPRSVRENRDHAAQPQHDRPGPIGAHRAVAVTMGFLIPNRAEPGLAPGPLGS